ncbi:MAG: ABC transporter ATP-binding protein [Acidimicrobiia bacterium]|nr:ABC transporter ATP-binding protein [Acidimicrobiia bacterium]
MTAGPAFSAAATIEVTDVSKWFGQKVAVSDLSCSFGPGLTGLLGPNGAGKTTLLRMLCGLLRPSDGSVRVLGVDPRRDPSVYRRLALVPEEDAVYGILTARQFVRFAADLTGVARDRVAEAIEAVDLASAADRPIAGFSKGMRQRAKVAAALVTRPEVLILDEPLNGTDPVQRAHLIAVFRRLAAEGRTVIVSSHVLSEVERMADRVLAVVDGRLAAAGDVPSIRRAMADIPYRVRIDVGGTRAVAAALLAEDVVGSVAVDGGRIHVETTDLVRLGRVVPRIAETAGARLTGFEPEDESLESVFRYLVHRR